MAAKKDIQEERELIRKAKHGDMEAMKRLHVLYRGLINKAIKESGAEMYQDRAILELEARRIIENLVRGPLNPDLDSQPSTFIYSNIKNSFRTQKNNLRNDYVQMPEAIARKSAIYHPVLVDLRRELNREPTDEEVFNEIMRRRQSNPKFARDFEFKNIERIKGMSRTDVIGNKMVGGDSHEGSPITSAENLMQSRMMGAEELYQRQQEEAHLQNIMNVLNLTRNERRAVHSFFGTGEFKTKKAKNINQAALNGGITNYQLKKILDQIRKEYNKGMV